MCCWCAKNSATPNWQWNAEERWRFMECGTRSRCRYRQTTDTCPMLIHIAFIKKRNKFLRRAIEAIRIMVDASICVCVCVCDTIHSNVPRRGKFKAKSKWSGSCEYSSMQSVRMARLYIWIFWWDMNFLLAFPKSFVAIWMRKEKKKMIFCRCDNTGKMAKNMLTLLSWCTRISKYLKFKFNIFCLQFSPSILKQKFYYRIVESHCVEALGISHSISTLHCTSRVESLSTLLSLFSSFLLWNIMSEKINLILAPEIIKKNIVEVSWTLSMFRKSTNSHLFQYNVSIRR